MKNADVGNGEKNNRFIYRQTSKNRCLKR